MFHVSDFLIYCFITAYTPGANNLLSMSNAARLGFRRSFHFNLGILAGFAVVMSVCTLFSTTLYAYLPKVKIFMQLAGAAYMLYLAWKVWKSSANIEADSGKEASFLAGMILQFANPKIYNLRNHRHDALHLAGLPLHRGGDWIYRPLGADRGVRLFRMGAVRVGHL